MTCSQGEKIQEKKNTEASSQNVGTNQDDMPQCFCQILGYHKMLSFHAIMQSAAKT